MQLLQREEVLDKLLGGTVSKEHEVGEKAEQCLQCVIVCIETVVCICKHKLFLEGPQEAEEPVLGGLGSGWGKGGLMLAVKPSIPCVKTPSACVPYSNA